MAEIVVDDALRARLNGLREHVTLRDETGRTLGHVLSDEAYWRLQMAADGCPLTYEELQQHLQEEGGRTLAEIMKDLEKTP